jgi:hypothetical protein
LWLLIVVETGVAAFHHKWWWALAGIVGVFYVGFVGARIHPTLSAAQLREGPTEGAAAKAEMEALTKDDRLNLIASAFARLHPVFILLLAANFLVVADWRWFVALPAAFIGGILLSALIMVTFAKANKELRVS